jgi:adenylate cyclase
MLKRIKYVSRFARPLATGDVEALATRAARKNEQLGLSGMLVTTGRLFLQVLEGPAEQVDRMYERILKDDRHTDVLLLSAEDDVPERMFPDWHMPVIDLDKNSDLRLEPLRAMLEAIVEQRELVDRLTSTLERALWRELTDR